MRRCVWITLTHVLLVQRSMGNCYRQYSHLICCVHTKAGVKGLILFCLIFVWYFLSLLLISSLACLQKVWFLTEMQLLGSNGNSEHGGRERNLKMRCVAVSKWIWRTWLLYNKRSLWDIFYLLAERRELWSWDMFLRPAMHNHRLWIVSKCCSESWWLLSGIKSRWMSLYISLRMHYLEHGLAYSIPFQAETSASRGIWSS